MKKEKDYYLLSLLIISLLNFVFMFVFGPESSIRYILLIFHFLLIIFCKNENILPLIFFIRPNFGLYDQMGFKYLFNITIIITSLKLIIFYGKTKNIKKSSFIILTLLFLYNILLVLLNNIKFSVLYTYISLFLSYIILIIFSGEKDYNFNKLYRYYSLGMICSALCGFMIPYSMYGMNIPGGYRFSGLMRDSNGYSLDLLFLIIGAFVYEKESGKNSLFYIILFSVLGFLGTSKMFLICLAFVVLYEAIAKISSISVRKVNMKNIKFFFILLLVVIYFNNKFDIYNNVVNNYISRFNSTSLTSGRNDISLYYIELLFDNPLLLLFGKSLEYSTLIGYGGWAMVHNTWLELLLSFGLTGSLIYLLFIISIINNNKSMVKYKGQLLLLMIIFCFCLGALPILSGDTLAILILYVILIKNISNKEKCNEKN